MKEIIINNRKANFNYDIISSYEAGIVLRGNEVKSLRYGEANISESYCVFDGNELYITNSYIAPYKRDWDGDNMDGRRNRKLLLRKNELRKLKKELQVQGNTVVPLKIYFKSNLAKCTVALCRGKHTYDKRESIKKRDIERENKNI